MAYIILVVESHTLVVETVLLPDQIRRESEYLAAIKSRALTYIKEGQLKRKLTAMDVLNWGAAQTPPWELRQVVAVPPTPVRSGTNQTNIFLYRQPPAQ